MKPSFIDYLQKMCYTISQYKDHITLSKKGKELPLSASVLCDIEYQPNDYSLILEQWDEQKDIYIANLEDIFSQFVNSSDKINGSFVYIVKAMRRWYLQLTKYEVVTKKVCSIDGTIFDMNPSVIKFRNALSSPELNSHEFLFEQLFKIFGNNGYEKLISSLRRAFQDINTTYKIIKFRHFNFPPRSCTKPSIRLRYLFRRIRNTLLIRDMIAVTIGVYFCFATLE